MLIRSLTLLLGIIHLEMYAEKITNAKILKSEISLQERNHLNTFKLAIYTGYGSHSVLGWAIRP